MSYTPLFVPQLLIKLFYDRLSLSLSLSLSRLRVILHRFAFFGNRGWTERNSKFKKTHSQMSICSIFATTLSGFAIDSTPLTIAESVTDDEHNQTVTNSNQPSTTAPILDSLVHNDHLAVILERDKRKLVFRPRFVYRHFQKRRTTVKPSSLGDGNAGLNFVRKSGTELKNRVIPMRQRSSNLRVDQYRPEPEAFDPYCWSTSYFYGQ